MLPRTVAAEALPTLVGTEIAWMHNGKKIGQITAATIKRKHVWIKGWLYEAVSPPTKGLGLSFDATETRIEDMNAPVWKVTKTRFTGAAVLPRNTAGYRNSRFKIIEGEPVESENINRHLIVCRNTVHSFGL